MLLASILFAGALPEMVSDADARGVAVRGPRGGAAAVRGPVRAPVRVAPVAPVTRGVARRTTRRTMRRMYTLPAGYRTAVVAGVSYYVVGGVYYRPYFENGATVYVEVEFDD